MFEVAVTSFSNVGMQEESGLGSLMPEAVFRGLAQAGSATGTTTVYKMSNSAWESIRPKLRALSQRRVPAVDALGARIAGATMPAITYDAVPLPGRHPRLTQIEHTVPLSTTVNGTTTLRGTNLLGGEKAVLDIYKQTGTENPGYAGIGSKFNRGVKILRLTAVAPGPIGNKIGVRIHAAGTGALAVTLGADGEVLIDITPDTGAPTAAGVRAQINGSAVTNVWITAEDLVGAETVPPTLSAIAASIPTAPQYTRPLYSYLGGGDGGGVSVLDVPVVAGVATDRLRLAAQRGGNQGNRITLTILADQAPAPNSVSVSGTDITVVRAAATTSIADLVTAINGNLFAAALVFASAIGNDALLLGDVSTQFLYGGSGETPTATVGGAASAITRHSDTSLVLTTTFAAYVAAGGGATEEALIQVLYGEHKLTGQISAAFSNQSGLSTNQTWTGVQTFDVPVAMTSTDSSGTPGAAVINEPSGRSAIALGATSVVITNSHVLATSKVFVSLRSADATLLYIVSVVAAAGSFTVTGNVAATADVVFDWFVIN